MSYILRDIFLPNVLTHTLTRKTLEMPSKLFFKENLGFSSLCSLLITLNNSILPSKNKNCVHLWIKIKHLMFITYTTHLPILYHTRPLVLNNKLKVWHPLKECISPAAFSARILAQAHLVLRNDRVVTVSVKLLK